jgi:hypothetical protein
MRERPILFSVVTGRPSLRGKRLRSKDGLTWKQRNRQAVNARTRTLYQKDVVKHRARASQYRKEHREKIGAVNKKWLYGYRRRLRAEMILAYGGKCSCCGETMPEFMQLDHIANDGAAERKRENANGVAFFARLKKRGWPKDRYQLLCANCNFGKLINGGICPHKKSR